MANSTDDCIPTFSVSKRYCAPFSCPVMGFDGSGLSMGRPESVQPEILTSLVEKEADINTQVRQSHSSRNSRLLSGVECIDPRQHGGVEWFQVAGRVGATATES